MNPPTTLAAYAAALAVVFAAAVGLGSAVGPVGAAAPPPAAEQDHPGDAAHDDTETHDTETRDTETHDAAGGEHAVEGADQPGDDLAAGGLAVASDGYALELARTTFPAGRTAELELVVRGPDGEPVTDYTPEHEKELHLIVVRRDMTGYQHLHPTRDETGRWSVPLALGEPGPYKVLADFTPADHDGGLALAADLVVPGEYEPVPLPAPTTTDEVDGYEVTLDGELEAGTSSSLAFTVSRDGREVSDLQPYLGAYGHLVVLREGDLAYLHVHPEGDLDGPAGPEVSFAADVPSDGTYRLFLDFAHGGDVHTAELTATTTGGAA